MKYIITINIMRTVIRLSATVVLPVILIVLSPTTGWLPQGALVPLTSARSRHPHLPWTFFDDNGTQMSLDEFAACRYLLA